MLILCLFPGNVFAMALGIFGIAPQFSGAGNLSLHSEMFQTSLG